MSSALVRAAARRSLATVRHVSVVDPDAADGLVADVYAQTDRDFGMLAPPVALHSPSPPLLAASWLLLRESLLATGSADRSAKEAVATAVSQANACPYCVDVHGATLAALGGGLGAEAPLVDWARTSGNRDACGPVPAPDGSAPELLAVAFTFQYLNRMVNVFLGASPLPPDVPRALRKHALGWLGRRVGGSGRYLRAGDALDLLPSAPLPRDLRWAAGRTPVAEALARAGAAIGAAGRRSVPDAVRDLVSAELRAWTGRPPGLSRAWVEPKVFDLPEPDRAAARLALLTALASYQVDGSVVAAYRQSTVDDGALIDLTAWASFAAARRIARWVPLAVPGTARSEKTTAFAATDDGWQQIEPAA